MVDAVQSHDGDVLKFLGDGILAVFPVKTDATETARVRDALAAVAEAREVLIRYNGARDEQGLARLDFGTALHLGELTYGNIGSTDRLDFTVIGETVNIASRAEGLTKELSEPVLFTRAVANYVDGGKRSLGAHTIRGINGTVELFAPA